MANQKGGFPIKNFSLLQKHFPTLSYIGAAKIPNKQKKALINTLSTEQIKTIGHMINNFLDRRIPVTEEAMKRLNKDKKYLYGLVSKKVPVKTKKKILTQKGGGILGPILAGLIPSVVPLARKIFKI